jgi:hypothetical protein
MTGKNWRCGDERIYWSREMDIIATCGEFKDEYFGLQKRSFMYIINSLVCLKTCKENGKIFTCSG